MHSLPGLPQVDDDFAFGDGSANLAYLASLPAIGGGAAGGALALPADVVGNGIVQESMDCELPAGLPIVSEVCACSQPLAASTSALPCAGGHEHVDALPEVPDNANMSHNARFRTRIRKPNLKKLRAAIACGISHACARLQHMTSRPSQEFPVRTCSSHRMIGITCKLVRICWRA